MYYVRKMSKITSLSRLNEVDHIGLLPSDFLGQEMKTTKNTLSVWRCESLNSDAMNNAVRAALLSSSSIEKTQFIILDSDALAQADIDTDDSELGKTGYAEFKNLHTNICNLTYEKIGVLLKLYKIFSQQSERVCQYEKEDVEKIIIQIYKAKCIDKSALNEHLLHAIDRLLVKENLI